MKPVFKNIFFGKYGLLLLSVVLFTCSILFNTLYNNRTSVIQEVRLVEKYLANAHKDFTALTADSSLLNRLLKREESLNEFTHLAARSYGFFLFNQNQFGQAEMRFWSDQLIVPPPAMLSADDGEYFQKLSNGWYYIIKKTLPGSFATGQTLSFAMVPVRSEFFIETDYLPQTFTYSNKAEKRVIISEKITDFPVQSVLGKTLFYLDKKVAVAVPYNDTLTIFLRFSALLFLLLFIHLYSESVARTYGSWNAILLLFVSLLLLRIVSYYFPSLLNLRQFELFDPAIYGSNYLQRSLGDLLVNAGLFCWFVLFCWSKLHHIENPLAGISKERKWVTGILSLGLLIFSTFLLASVIRSLVADSKISFDVTDFSSLDRYTIAGFVALAAISFSYYYFSQLLFQFIFPVFRGRHIYIYFSIGIFGLIYLTFRSGNAVVLFFIPVLLWLLAYTWLVNRRSVKLSRIRINIASTLAWIFLFSLSISAIMLAENRKMEWEKRKRLAEKLAVQTDPSSERLMSIANQYLDNDFLGENFSRFKDARMSIALKDSIVNENYSGYLNKYDTRLYIYDEADRPLFNEDSTTFESLTTILNVQSKPTKVPNMYYYETSFDKFNYITRRDIVDETNKKQGTFFIVSNPKNYSRDALFPELFKQFKRTDPENSPTYSIAVYADRQLVSPPGNYPFAIFLKFSEVPKEEFFRQINGEYDELWYRASNEKVVVIARKKETALETITLFSYIFCAFLLLVALIQFITLLFKAGHDRQAFRKQLQLNIRAQVHSTIIFISIFSFLIIAWSTISFFIIRFNRNNSDKLSRTMKIMVNEMEKKLSDHSLLDDVIKIYDSVSNIDLQKLVNEISDIHGVDVNVYSLTGDLQVTSEANVYTKGVLSKKMDPAAFYHLDRLRQVQHAQEEKIGNFSFLSIYSPVRDEKGDVYAYINIPYFTSKPELDQEISNFLLTIINLNAFIFLIAGLIALLVANRITRSFSFISDKMKEVNLGKLNEEITWNREDEIGELVIEYNKMVGKLGESAAALAKSEREGAWREMARQVAHEIKNPLTPMKLSIQYLQKAINNNQPNVKELSSSVADTLVEQIDHLSKIAADFSQFANIGNTNVTLFDLHEVLNSLKKLYASDESLNFAWNPVRGSIKILADKTQMNRLFTNLFTNAIDACRGNDSCKIELNEIKINDIIRISIKDNGEGIPEEVQEKIFIPNFTTKSSGTGLGLAMCKGIVEQAKGKIWFETEQGKGTTFFVELPLES